MEALSNSIDWLAERKKSDLKKMSGNAIEYYRKKFDKEKLMNRIEEILVEG